MIYLLIRIPLHNGYKEGYGGYFIFAAFISIILVTITTKSFITHFIKSAVGLFLIVWITGLFWGYMDHPWLAGLETNTCDGTCFGWFSFENDDPSMVLAICGTIFILLTGLIKTVVILVRKQIITTN